MFDHDNDTSNKSQNRRFTDVLETCQSRRKLLQGGLGLAATTFIGAAPVASAANRRWGWGKGNGWGWNSGQINFTPVTLAEGNGPLPAISPEYQYQVLIPWGEPLEPSGPEWNYPPSASDQAQQVGIGHDGMWFFPCVDDKAPRYGWNNHYDNNPWRTMHSVYGDENTHGVLCINFEFGSNSQVLGKGIPESLEDVRVSQHAHGVGVIELRKSGRGRWGGGEWRQVESKLARRIHVNTPVTFSGPVAGHELLDTPNGNVPLGTVNNCGNGFTPWGTYITCEENFNGYFGANGHWEATAEQARYGFSANGFGYGWHMFDRRFDLSDADYRNEEHRFGWLVEIDPFDATAMPVKRTALGRFKHEGAAVHVDESTGHVVVYSGDDERFDYIYKFVSEAPWRQMMAQGKSPLDHGTLYVAKFNDDNSGEWLELSMNTLSGHFTDMGELLVFTRMAADIAGATPMDRPEWISVAPDGRVYCTLTNNSRRTESDAANPMAPNADGHIIRWKETSGFTGNTFSWDIFLIAEDTHGTEESFSDPDGIYVDPDGRVFIETDGGQKDGLNNQILVANADTGEVRRLLTGPAECEVTGIAMTPDHRTMFVNIQHPGERNGADATNFPVMNSTPDGVTIPRDATLVVTRKDGGKIGS